MHIRIKNTIRFNIFNKGSMLSILLCVYMYLNIIKLFSATSIIYELLSIAVALATGLAGMLNGGKIVFNKNYFLITGILLLFYSVLQIVNSRSIFTSIYILTNGLIVYIILRNKLNPIFFYINYLCICLIFLKLMYSDNTANSILSSGSQNVVSFNIFINLVLLHCVEYINNKKLSIFPVLLLVILSIWAVGRSGIIVSIVYLIFMMYYAVKNKKLWSKITAFTLIFILGLIIHAKYTVEINTIIDGYFYKFSRGGVNYAESDRMDFIKIYCNNINTLTLFSGYNYDYEPYFVFWNKNPHNSFIHAHSFFGFLAFPFFLFLFSRLIHMIKEKKIFFFITLLLVLFRANMDNFFFFGPYDFVVFFILLYGFHSKYLKLKIW